MKQKSLKEIHIDPEKKYKLSGNSLQRLKESCTDLDGFQVITSNVHGENTYYDYFINLIDRYNKTDKSYIKNKLHLLFGHIPNKCKYLTLLLGCSYDTCAGYFKKKGNNVTLINLLRICNAIKISIDYFLQDGETEQ